MPPCLTWISVFCWVLAGCSTDKETLLPMESKPCWTSGTAPVRKALSGNCWMLGGSYAAPLARADFSFSLQEPYTRTAANEIRNLFPRLPNPDLVLYVYPHLSAY